MSPALWDLTPKGRRAAVRLYRRHHTRTETREWLLRAIAGAAKVLYRAEALAESREDALEAYRRTIAQKPRESDRAYTERLLGLLAEARERLE